MASNEIPRPYDPVVALAEDAADGAAAHAGPLGLQQNTEARIQQDLTALKTASATMARANTAKSNAFRAHQTQDSNAKAFIGRFIQFEKPRIGNDWGPLWQEAGFQQSSIAIPRTMDDRFTALGKLRDFLENNPTFEVTDPERPELDVTKLAASNLYQAVSDARQAVNQAIRANGEAVAARDAKLEAMRARLTGLRNELTQLPLPGDSPTWYAFGFNRPDDPETPGQPENLTLTPGAAGSGVLIVDWAPARRATGYRVLIAVAGETTTREFGLFADDQTTLSSLPLGKTLTVTVIAHNQAGDGPASAPAGITLG